MALLHLVRGEFQAAAELLATAPGLGWSGRGHPGHLLFPLFCRMVGGGEAQPRSGAEEHAHRGLDWEEVDRQHGEQDGPTVPAASPEEILETAGAAGACLSGKERRAVIQALRSAAENRVAGVTEMKRRKYYRHAAQLVADCVAVDPSRETRSWAADVRADYRRFSALQRELKSYLGRSC